MSTDEAIDSPVICVTPLYHFASDVPEISLGRGIRIVAFRHYTGPPFDEVVVKYLERNEPQYLLISDPLLSGDVYADDVKECATANDAGMRFTNLFVYGTFKLFAILRLFKPGRLRAGETFVLMQHAQSGDEGANFAAWGTVGSGRASTMAIDYQQLYTQTTSYVLNAEELPFLIAFRQRLLPHVRDLDQYTSLETAFSIYGEDHLPHMQAVELMTAFEALVTKKDEVEGLTYRLGLRVANFLGRDAQERKTIFRQVKQFYGLRSRIVHGADLDPKISKRFDEIEPMRELLRRLLLSVLALLSNGKRLVEIPDLLDEMACDDDQRKEVQRIASGFLYL
jgi:Apea-like HEPN